MTFYRTWFPDELDTIADSIEVKATSAEEAAKSRAIDEYLLQCVGPQPVEFTIAVETHGCDGPLRFRIEVHIPDPVATVKEVL